MDISNFKFRHRKYSKGFLSHFRFRLTSIFRAMKFAWKNPSHVQVAVKFYESGDRYDMDSNWAGIDDDGVYIIIRELGKEAEEMIRTESELKEILNPNERKD